MSYSCITYNNNKNDNKNSNNINNCNNNNNNIVKLVIIIVFDNIFFCFLFANSRKNYDKEQRKNDNNEKEF